MKEWQGRGVRLSDAMILVAATAVGCSLIDRQSLTVYLESHSYYLNSIAFGISASPILLAWTIAAAAIRLRRPRPSFRRIARQPGAVACFLVSVFAPALFAISLLFQARVLTWRPGKVFPGSCFYSLATNLAFLVAGAWIAQWWNGRWRPEPSAIDRFGRLVGLGWIVLYLITTLGTAFFMR